MAAVAAPINSAIYRGGEMLPPKVIYDRLFAQVPIAESTGLLPPLAKIVMEYVLESAIFGWYTAFTKLYTKQEQEAIKLPALPPNIVQTFLGPITAEEARAFRVEEGTAVSKIYSLRLVHKGSLNEYEERLARYREHPDDPNIASALKFRYFWPAAQAQKNTVNEKWGWALVSNDILTGSRNKPFEKQQAMLPNNCELTTLPIVCTSAFDHALATGERLLKEGNKTRKLNQTNATVLERTQNKYLAVGSFAPDGLGVYSNFGFGGDNFGVVVMRKFFF